MLIDEVNDPNVLFDSEDTADEPLIMRKKREQKGYFVLQLHPKKQKCQSWTECLEKYEQKYIEFKEKLNHNFKLLKKYIKA